jgi:DNA-binding NtrC family response regulator
MTVKASILVVDDEENLRRTLALILQREGYRVTTAASVREARSCLEAGAFDLVFLDLKLPDASGLTLLPEMHNQFPHMPVLILTAHDKLGIALEAVRGGARDYLLKPVDPPVLLARVKEVLAEV